MDFKWTPLEIEKAVFLLTPRMALKLEVVSGERGEDRENFVSFLNGYLLFPRL